MEFLKKYYPNCWPTRKNKLILIKNMRNEHILNSLAFIERTDKIDALLGYKIAFIEELNKRGIKHDFEA